QSSLWSLWRAHDVARKVLDMGHKRMRWERTGRPHRSRRRAPEHQERPSSLSGARLLTMRADPVRADNQPWTIRLERSATPIWKYAYIKFTLREAAPGRSKARKSPHPAEGHGARIWPWCVPSTAAT